MMSADVPYTDSKKGKRARVNFTEAQVSTMEKVFFQTQYPDVTVLEILSDKLNLRLEKICTWFQNRRSKFRRESKKGHIEWMRKQLYTSDKPPTVKEKECVLSPVPQQQETHSNCPTGAQAPRVNIHHMPDFSKCLLPLSVQTDHHVTSSSTSTTSQVPNISHNNNNIYPTQPSCCYFNYQHYCSEASHPMVSSAYGSTSTSWSCTKPNMSTPQNYLSQSSQKNMQGCMLPHSLTNINNYPYQLMQHSAGIEGHVYTTATNNTHNLSITPGSMFTNRNNTFNNCHFHGPVSF